MNTSTTSKTVAVTTITMCLSCGWFAPAHATTVDNCELSAVWAEPDPGQVIGQRKMRAAHDFVANADARAEYAATHRQAEQRNGATRHDEQPRPCAKFPDLCNGARTQ